MRLRLEHTVGRLTRRKGLILINRFGDKINSASAINRVLRQPGSNRGLDASDDVFAMTEMIIDGATCLEDIRLFEGTGANERIAFKLTSWCASLLMCSGNVSARCASDPAWATSRGLFLKRSKA